jgi:release factor glutamine methyltransferase
MTVGGRRGGVIQAGVTVGAARRLLAAQFRTAGIETPELDARILVGHALGLDHAALAAATDRSLDARDVQAINGLAQRRLAREPVARILGRKEFWGLSLALNAATLVPRPETETVVEAALEIFARTRPLRIADIGTGSGALLLALLTEYPAAHGVGTDISVAALECARDNAAALGLAARAPFIACDLAAALAGGFDLVVSNPPYIASGDLAALAAEVRDHDPRLALDGGPDGLAAYRAIAADAHRLLSPNGTLIVEMGAGQHEAVTEIFVAAGLAAGAVRRDLSGVARALMVKPLP